MKKNRNLFLLLLVLIVVSSCKKDEEATPATTMFGRWDANDATGKITKLDFQNGKPTDYDLTQKLTGITYEFKEDKTFTLYDSEKAQVISGSYTLKGYSLKLTYKKVGEATIENYTVNLSAGTGTMK